jgi:hypothetical protein
MVVLEVRRHVLSHGRVGPQWPLLALPFVVDGAIFGWGAAHPPDLFAGKGESEILYGLDFLTLVLGVVVIGLCRGFRWLAATVVGFALFLGVGCTVIAMSVL